MKTRLLAAAIFFSLAAAAQGRFSLSTGISLLRNLTSAQTFWSPGQTICADFYFSPRQAAYISLDYYKERGFTNHFTATAKLPATLPQTISFTANGRLRYRQVSLGIKHYFKDYPAVKRVNVYGLAGFGFLFARATNTVSSFVDTAAYNTPVLSGQSGIKRLSFDAGLGADVHAASFLYLFGSVRAWLPASYQQSPLLHNNDRVPLALMASAGLRIFFGGY